MSTCVCCVSFLCFHSCFVALWLLHLRLLGCTAVVEMTRAITSTPSSLFPSRVLFPCRTGLAPPPPPPLQDKARLQRYQTVGLGFPELAAEYARLRALATEKRQHLQRLRASQLI